jgi:hypothetical protein
MVIGLVTQEQLEALGAVAERLDARGLEDESRMLREVLVQLRRTQRDVPATTAAEILDVPPETIGNWVRRGILPGRWDRAGHCYVSVEALEPTLRMRRVLPDTPAGTITDEEIDAEIDAVRAARRARAAGGR